MTGEDAPGVDGAGDDAGFDPVAFLEAAVRTASHEDVSAMRDLLVGSLRAAGAEPSVDAAGNVRASKRAGDVDGSGAGGGPHVVLNTHLDTVSPGVPFERDGATIRGRGACDAKGPLAALVAAYLRTDPAEGRLTLAVTPDEETLSTGAAALTGRVDSPVETVDGDLYVVGEPTGLDVCTAAKGRFQATVRLTGETAHAAEADAGVNAVAAAEGALRAVRGFDADRPAHDQLGAPLLTPTVIGGGNATNQTPADCELVVDRRAVPPESAEEFRAGLERDVAAAVPEEVGVAVELTDRESPFLEAFATDPDGELPRTLARAAREAADAAGVDGGGDRRPFTAATEASYFAPAPTVVFGPGYLADDEGAVAHSEREYVPVPQVTAAADAVGRALDALLGG